MCVRIARREVFLWFRGGTQSSGSIALALFGTVRVRSAPFSGAFKRAFRCATRPLAGTVALQFNSETKRLTNEPHWHQYLEKQILKKHHDAPADFTRLQFAPFALCFVGAIAARVFALVAVATVALLPGFHHSVTANRLPRFCKPRGTTP